MKKKGFGATPLALAAIIANEDNVCFFCDYVQRK